MSGWYGVRLFRRLGLLGWSLLLLFLAVWPASSERVNAAADSGNDKPAGQEVYSQLRSGERVWKDKDYVKAEKPTVYLTFDDGPSRLTDRVLDILREEEVKATFFVLGEQVRAYPEQLKRAAKEGHAIGNHTYNHIYKELYSGFGTFWGQIVQTEEVLADTAGIRTRLVRAPGGTFGNFDAFYFYFLDQAGYEVHDWNMDSGDSRRVGVPAAEIIQTVSKGPFGDTVILLMHDGTGHDQTVKALPDIIRLFKNKGYAFASLDSHVQPVHFPASKPRWSRQLSAAAFERYSAEAGGHLLALEEADSERRPAMERPGEGETRSEVSAAASGTGALIGTAAQEPLEVVSESGNMVLEAGQYRIADGHYQVPLRQLLGALGGKVEWRDEQRTVAAQYGLKTLEYDFVRQELRVQGPGQALTIHLPQMELRAGTVYVPLRDTLELLGNPVESYGLENGVMKIHTSDSRRFFTGVGF